VLSKTAGQTIQDARNSRGLSQFELAVKTKVSVATISDLETGRNLSPRRRTLEAVCKPLQLSVDDLISREEEATPA
jgi:transcriptional regulator with XRE-family HTH domain